LIFKKFARAWNSTSQKTWRGGSKIVAGSMTIECID
jgi:hypothetical protein